MGMSLSNGGHLTHGAKVNVSGRYFKVVPYGVDKNTETINYDEVENSPLRKNRSLSWRAQARILAS